MLESKTHRECVPKFDGRDDNVRLQKILDLNTNYLRFRPLEAADELGGPGACRARKVDNMKSPHDLHVTICILISVSTC